MGRVTHAATVLVAPRNLLVVSRLHVFATVDTADAVVSEVDMLLESCGDWATGCASGMVTERKDGVARYGVWTMLHAAPNGQREGVGAKD